MEAQDLKPPEPLSQIDSRPTKNVSKAPKRAKTNVSKPFKNSKNSKPPKNRLKSTNTGNQFCYWKFGTINVLTASDDFCLAECLRQCTRADLDIVCFQESRRLGKETMLIPFTIDGTKQYGIYTGVGMYKRQREAGVAIAFPSSKKIKIEEVGQISLTAL